MSETALSFVIDTEVTSAYLGDLLNFIQEYYILPRRQFFTNVQRITVNHDHLLAFTVLGPEGRGYIDVEMRAGRPIQVRMVPSDETVPQEALDQLKEDLIIGSSSSRRGSGRPRFISPGLRAKKLYPRSSS